MKKEEKDIFIAFHTQFNDQIANLNSKLEASFKVALKSCVAEEENQQFIESYEPNDIKKAKIFLCCLTNEYIRSTECTREFAYAISLKKNVIALKENSDNQDIEHFLEQYSRLNQIECITYFGDLTKWLETEPKLIKTLVEQTLHVNIY